MKPTTAIVGSLIGVLAAQAQETCERTQVAVLGAGVAGISAAVSPLPMLRRPTRTIF
ncbi:hypothetical protein BJX61DRAFT_544806 [Aspergillus egyptiacus]|nr:hypothetical protein BJX61DRAFT_544806 [Aspergillus egyptiacus]